MKAHHGDEAWLAALNTNGCRGKVRHPSKAHALANGRQLAARGRDALTNRRLALNAYKCPTCGRWHLGHFSRRALTDASAIVDTATPLERALAAALKPYLDAERSVS